MKRINYTGLSSGASSYFLLEQYARHLPSCMIAVVKSSELSSWQHNLQALAPLFPLLIPVQIFPHQDVFERVTVLSRLAQNPRGIILSTAEALQEKTAPAAHIHAPALTFAVGST